MISNREKYIWLTDSHLYFFNRYKLLNSILDQKAKAVFLTGDFSEGPSFLSNLEFFGKKLGRPLYFVMGNHEYHFSSFAKTHQAVRDLCAKYPNLIWMTENGIVPLNDEAAVIGTEGWYSVDVGNPIYLQYTFDWWMIEEFRKLPSMKKRIEKFKDLASDSAKLITKNLSEAIETYKTVYLLTHFPPYREADRYHSWISETFWEPYNTNITMGKAIDKVMENNKKRNVIVLSGHTHSPMQIHVSRNVECRVGKGSYHKLTDDEIFFI
jgi:predicted phosphohydrolase